MDNTMLYIIAAIFVVSGVAFHLFISWRRHQNDHRDELAPVLESHGLQFISSKWPGIGKTGLFPRMEVRIGGPQSHVGKVKGEYREYRIVKCRDKDGNVFTLWACLEFELFKFRYVRWRSQEKDKLPESLIALLEKF